MKKLGFQSSILFAILCMKIALQMQNLKIWIVVKWQKKKAVGIAIRQTKEILNVKRKTARSALPIAQDKVNFSKYEKIR